VENLVDDAWKIPYAIRVDAVTNFQHTFAEYHNLVVENLIEDAAQSTDEVLAAAQRVALAEPLIRDRIINGEASVTGVNVTLQLPGEDPGEVTTAVEAARHISEEFRTDNPAIDLYMTGFAMLNNAFQEISVSELTRLMPIMFGLMILLMVVMLRSATGTFATMLIIGLSTTVAMGLGGMFKVGLTPPSAQAPTIIMTLAIADSIHILVTMLREMRNGRSKFDAIVESIRVNASPVFLTSFSTVIGFLSLNYSDVPPFNHLGNITAAGVTAAFFLSVIFLPALLAILPIRTRLKSTSSRPSPIMDRLAEFVIDRRRIVLAGSAVVVLLFAALIPTNELDDRFVEYFDHRIEFRTDTDFTSENLTGIYQIEFSLSSGESGGVSNPEYLATVDAFADWYRSQPDVVHVSSISDIMKRLNKNLKGDDESFYRLPDNREMAAQYLLLYEMSLPYGLDLNNQINVDKSATRFTVTTDNTSASRFRELTEEGQDWLAGNAARPMSASGSGPAVMFSYISGININSMLKGSLIALLLISFLMIFALRSVKLGMISFIPNLLPAVVAFGVWAALNGTVNLGLSIVIGMTMGIVVDDSIHFLTKYSRARTEKSSNAADAVRYAFSSVGRAIVVTSVILVAGFGILSTSAFGMNADMGLMTAITIGLALVIDLFALPAILLWLDASEAPAAARTYEAGAHQLEPSPVRVTA
jgi:predicted RND superfamily exporter protein